MAYDHLSFARKFLIISMVVITLVVSAIFFAFNMRSEELTVSVLHQQAKSLFNQVILLRRWITGHGGVYVLVRPGVAPNPFLTTLPNLKVNIVDQQDGKLYTLRNPGLATREMSQLSLQSEGYSFHISSLKPINIETNSPDAFERQALLKFEQGIKEVYGVEQRPEGPTYRYMAPLVYENTCNRCHSHQGYKIGDIRGGVSISIPMNDVVKKMHQNRIWTAASAVTVLLLLFGVLACIYRRFMRTVREAQASLVEMAIMDATSGLLNRRAGLQRAEEEISRQKRSGRPFSCLLLDLDHFKGINDTYGHLSGDEAITQFGSVLKGAVRKHDIVCRYGGEEFLVLLPDTDLPAAQITAEKIRRRIEEMQIAYQGRCFNITTSIGVTQLVAGEEVDALVSRADMALYQAKHQGRNQVCCAEALERKG